MSSIQEKHSWITQEFVTGLIQGDDLPVTDENRVSIFQLKLEPAVGKGENYSSDLVRAMAKYLKGRQLGFKFAFFVIKEDLKKTRSDEVLDAYNVFHRETVCYRDILPKVNNLLKSIGDESCLHPLCLQISDQTVPRYFVFEDLRHREFKNADRKVGLDFDHMRLAMIKLGKWHASTAHLANIGSSSMDHHKLPNISSDVKFFHGLFENAMKSCSEEVATWPGFEKYAEKLLKLVPVTIAKGCKIYTRDDSEFNVLTHGDLWVNNIMYHYDSDKKPDDAIFVDYAVGFYGSPAIDLSYFLCSSGLETTNDSEWDLLIQIYHTELAGCLKKLGYAKKIPSLVDIQLAFLRKGFLGVMFSTFLIALRLLEDTKDADLGALLGEEPQDLEFRKKLFSVFSEFYGGPVTVFRPQGTSRL